MHRGNKSFLPRKPCATCGRPMSSRRAWAKNRDAVRHCSAACRRNRVRATGTMPVPDGL